jgi:hypothetical protein
MEIWLEQIKDLDKIPHYLNRLGELSIEDNNIVLNCNSGGTSSDTSHKALGAGFTIQDGDANGNDVHFQIGKLNTLNSASSNDYNGSVGYLNLGFTTELNDIVIRNSNLEDLDGSRVLAEGDVLDGGKENNVGYSGVTRGVKILNKTSTSDPIIEDLIPGELSINISNGKMFTLKKKIDDSFEIIQFVGSTLNENSTLSEPLTLYSSTPTSPSYSNRVIGVTKIENTQDSNVVYNLHHFYNAPTNYMRPVSWDINNNTVPAKITFIAPENGNVRVVMRTYLQDGGGNSESYVGLHNAFEDTQKPSEGWYQIVKESEKNEHDLENIEFLIEGLTPNQSYNYYFVAVTTQSSGVSFLVGRKSPNDWSNNDLAKPTTITVYDMGNVEIITNPSI